MRKCWFLILIVLGLNGHLASAAESNVPGSNTGTVSGSGIETIKRAPDTLRMQVQFVVHGKDAKDALTKLKARRVAVKKALEGLGVGKDMILSSEPHVAAQDDARRQQLQMMVQQRLRQQGKAAPKKEETKPVSLSIDFEAEWPLKGADSEELFLTAHELREKIEAEMTTLRGTEAISPEEEEVAEELQGIGYNDNGPKPGEPTFTYVAQISQADVERLLAVAFQKARKQAAALSKAAGASLGPLAELSSNNSFGTDDGSYTGSYGRAVYYGQTPAHQSSLKSSSDDADAPVEAYGNDPSEVSATVTVNASFFLKE